MNSRIAIRRLTDIVGNKKKAEDMHYVITQILEDYIRDASIDNAISYGAFYWEHYFKIAEQSLKTKGYIKEAQDGETSYSGRRG